MEFTTTYLVLACLFGFFMAWGIGANDVANAMGTSVGSRALTFKQAIIIAAVFEAAGAILAGGSVTHTIRSGIISPEYFIESPELLVFSMLAALLASGLWLLIASYFGWPVSTTHSIVGALVGVGAVGIGAHAVEWHQVTNIVLSWILTPLIAAVLSYALFKNVYRLVLNTPDPFASAKRYVPFYIFLTIFIISLITLTKGLKHLGLDLTLWESLSVAAALSLIGALIGKFWLRDIATDPKKQKRYHFANVEVAFGILMIITACAMAFAHGSNDVANAIGPLSAIFQVVQDGGKVSSQVDVPFWILGLGAVGIVAGLSMLGYKVIKTIGNHITELTPSRGFAANLGCATTVIIASGTGLPISTSQTLVGAVLGVGFARGIAALNLNVIRNIFMSWVITLPAGAFFAVAFFYLLKYFLT
jgi:PiT family inorganic phosphate transporter